MLLNRMRVCQIALLLGCLLSTLPTAEARWWKKLIRAKKNQENKAAVENVYLQPDHSKDIPGVPFLVEALGKEMYAAVKNRPKFRFWIYMTLGSQLPDETTFVTLLNGTCNLLYGLSTLIGFLMLPRGFMLVVTAVTVLVGPALVLIMLGIMALVLIAFALYPITSVATLWIFFFLTSHMAQVLGCRLGLDKDQDGDVDWLDLLHLLASTKTGKFLCLDSLHDMLNESTMNQFQRIHRRLDEIQRQSSTRRVLAPDLDKTSVTLSHEDDDDDGEGQWIPLNNGTK